MSERIILDVGLCNGDDSAYYLSQGYKVIAIEANPLLAKAALKRFESEINSGQFEILNVGITPSGRKLPFYICELNPDWSSFEKSIASRENAKHYSIDVECVSFSEILEKYETPFYLKVDIEGHDLHCLRALRPPNLPQYVSFEMDGTLDGLIILRHLGYQWFKAISQTYFLPLQNSKTRRQKQAERLHFLSNVTRRLGGQSLIERRLANLRTIGTWNFSYGSSGPFGEATPGEWLRFEELSDLLKASFERRNEKLTDLFWTGKEYSFWMDIHAKL